MSRPSLLGIIAALPAEARAAGAVDAPVGQVIRIGDQTLLVRCGIGRGRAAGAAGDLVKAGAGALLSWGTAAALDDELSPGDLLLPATVLSRDGRRFAVDAPWRNGLARLLTPQPAAGVGSVAEAEQVLREAGDKRRLQQSSGARIADMESAAIAEICQASGLRLLVARAVSDRVSMRVPDCALRGVNADGDPALASCLRELLLAPADLPALLRLAAGFKRACVRLSALAREAGPRFQLPEETRPPGSGAQA